MNLNSEKKNPPTSYFDFSFFTFYLFYKYSEIKVNNSSTTRKSMCCF